MILAGDIGGSSTRLAFFKVQGPVLHLEVEQTFRSKQYPRLVDIVREFVAAHPSATERACFGIAGPVQQGRVAASNLPWIVEAKTLAQELKLSTVKLINDLEANAYGIATLSPDDFVILNAGVPDARGNAAVISAGTGLGEAGLYWDGQTHHPFACEGGHADFAPRNDLEAELLRYASAKFGHVSYERVLSGPGLYLIYQFLRDTGRGEEPAALAEEMGHTDPSRVVSQAGAQDRYELCVKALDLFISFYGAEAGNFALKTMATGGVFVGGGIAPNILNKLQGPTFMRAFIEKGRMRPLLEKIPVRVILKELTALWGAARCAALPDHS